MTQVGSSLITGVRVGDVAAQRIYVGDQMAWQPYTGDGSMYLSEYVGTGSTTRQITGVPFTPGLLFFTNDSNPSNYPRYWIDSWGSPQPRYWAMNGLSPMTYGWNSLNADGWTSGSSAFNGSGKSYQVFAWPKGDASQQLNTDGSISSTIFVNQQAGWSSGSYVGNGSSGQTFGHGLEAVPVFVMIWGGSSGTTNGRIRIAGFGQRMNSFDEPGTEETNSGILATDASLITVSGIQAVNELGTVYQYVAFTDVTGKVASGSINGDGVNTEIVSGLGFEPRLVLLAGNDGTGNEFGTYAYTARTDQVAPYYANYRTLCNSFSTPDPQSVSSKFSILSDGFQIEAVNRGNNGANAAYWVAFA